MAKQISVEFSEKMDQSLAEICNGGRGLAPSARVPILVRCHRDAIGQVSDLVTGLGGRVRHQIKLIGAVAAWIPLSAVERVARDDRVSHMEFEQTFSIA